METKPTERELAEQRDANVAAMIASGNAIQREIAKQALDAKQAVIDELVARLESTTEWLLLQHGEPPADIHEINEYHREIVRNRAALAKARGGDHA